MMSLSSQEWPSLRRLCETDHLHEALEDPLLPFELTKRAVEQIGRQVEEFCDKEFTSISQTSLSDGMHFYWCGILSSSTYCLYVVYVFLLKNIWAFIYFSWQWRATGISRRDRGGKHRGYTRIWSKYLTLPWFVLWTVAMRCDFFFLF